ncbi:transcriptional regulator, GntR family [Peptoclostridium acidaminophilum DSM 3953]|uniref:Transcriptional regulator, GntR family n=1 Tax=Peptoclostridium acidaminophilum DSM 3953 TaxID=1286171 RepID=W8TLM4_PEPAC|nr:GntR family transcriptional regulator [Peptoclostridium acidaminophilum]AHM57092.1 transcriptional regulator, GntR family [Peptoclostridium acidaminophilum DSM 3953]
MKGKIGNLKLENYKPLRDIVFEHLREAILIGKLEPSTRLMEVQLADELGVSRTPVREAIRKLELEGLVEMIPRKGAYVADVSVKDVEEVLEIRTGLEGFASMLAAQRMMKEDLGELKRILEIFKKAYEENNPEKMVESDIAFHEVIFKATTNKKLMQMNNSLREQIYRFRRMYIVEYHKSENLIKEHEDIIEAIEKRDGELAMHKAMKHIKLQQEFIVEQTKAKKSKY